MPGHIPVVPVLVVRSADDHLVMLLEWTVRPLWIEESTFAFMIQKTIIVRRTID